MIAARLRGAEDELRRHEEANRTMNVLKERVHFAYDESTRATSRSARWMRRSRS